MPVWAIIKAMKWTASYGSDIEGIGFQATAQTGYDSNASLKYDFANATQVNYVCGTNALPPNP